MRYDGGGVYILRSGREISANHGIFGITSDPLDWGTNFEGIFDGYDSAVYHGGSESENPRFTAAERREIAEHMIALWRAWGGAP